MSRMLLTVVLALVQVQFAFAQSPVISAGENVTYLAVDRTTGETCIVGSEKVPADFRGVELKQENPEALSLEEKVSANAKAGDIKACNVEVKENAQVILDQMKNGPKAAGWPVYLGLAYYGFCTGMNVMALADFASNIMSLGGNGDKGIGTQVSQSWFCAPVTYAHLGIVILADKVANYVDPQPKQKGLKPIY